MNVFFYVVEHDLGFAPNPFHGVCSLGCCKPDIRKIADVGDYVLGTGAVKPKLRGHLTYWMKVDEVLTFDQYWEDPRFRRKKPVMQGTTYLRYGDNIYHRNGGDTFQQEDSFHSNEDGNVSPGDLKRDTAKTDKVLLGRTFAFWGRSGIPIPSDIAGFLKTGPGHRYKFTEPQKQEIIVWLEGMPARGYIDEPAHWQFLEKKPRKNKA
jgi:hypothetical protein